MPPSCILKMQKESRKKTIFLRLSSFFRPKTNGRLDLTRIFAPIFLY